jgi:hypothetical protein
MDERFDVDSAHPGRSGSLPPLVVGVDSAHPGRFGSPPPLVTDDEAPTPLQSVPAPAPAPPGSVVVLVDADDLEAVEAAMAGRPPMDPVDDEAKGAADVRVAPRRRLLTTLGAVAVLLLVAATAIALRGPDTPARSPYAWDNLPVALRAHPAARWSIPLDGARLIDADTAGGTIYAGLDDGGIARIVALDQASGSTRWAINLPVGLRLQQLVVDGDIVVVVSLGGDTLRFAVLERSTGISRWSATVGGRFAAVAPSADRLVLLSGNEPRIFDRAAGYDRVTGEQL